ncbi:MAG: hypothetical protein D4S01_04485 [Dehalococcoidia bacterium]|nr:MAG: hypothetical protein D4S01_04485 [Dehalococcoidia bacterium]
MTLAVNNFKAKLTGGGARPNLYRCTITNPHVRAGINPELTSFMCKGASLPSSVIGQIDVPFRGRQIRVAGDRTFENWTATIFNEASFAVRSAFERWMNAINGNVSGIAQSTNPADYQAQIEIDQLDRRDNVIKTYTLEGAFPINVGAIDLAFDANDAIEEFTVEFAYQYWV